MSLAASYIRHVQWWRGCQAACPCAAGVCLAGKLFMPWARDRPEPVVNFSGVYHALWEA